MAIIIKYYQNRLAKVVHSFDLFIFDATLLFKLTSYKPQLKSVTPVVYDSLIMRLP